MADVGPTIQILSPSTDTEWCDAEGLIAELKEWDLRQCKALGFDADVVLSVFYPDTIEDIRRESTSPDGCFLVCRNADSPIGCAAFRRLTPSACELYDVYVRPSGRGQRIGRL